MWLGLLRTPWLDVPARSPSTSTWIAPFVLSSVFRRGSTGIATPIHLVDSSFGFNEPCHLFTFFLRATLQPLDPFRQFRKAANPSILFLEFFERPCGRAPDDLRPSHDLPGGDSCLRPNHGVVFDFAMIRDPYLPAASHILTNFGRPRYPGLRRDNGVFPDDYVVR